jgi:hypothetical protein
MSLLFTFFKAHCSIMIAGRTLKCLARLKILATYEHASLCRHTAKNIDAISSVSCELVRSCTTFKRKKKKAPQATVELREITEFAPEF